jgi:hypothetical protein
MNYWTQGQFRSARIILGLTRVELAQELDCGLRTVERCDAEGCRIIEGEMVRDLKKFREQGIQAPVELVAFAMRLDASVIAKREKQMSSEFI